MTAYGRLGMHRNILWGLSISRSQSISLGPSQNWRSPKQSIPALFTDPACGHVLRAKGFVQDENGWVELNATADGLTANAIPKGQEVLIVIGEGLEKERIEVRLHKGSGFRRIIGEKKR